jgi:hypothetical protein
MPLQAIAPLKTVTSPHDVTGDARDAPHAAHAYACMLDVALAQKTLIMLCRWGAASQSSSNPSSRRSARSLNK